MSLQRSPLTPTRTGPLYSAAKRSTVMHPMRGAVTDRHERNHRPGQGNPHITSGGDRGRPRIGAHANAHTTSEGVAVVSDVPSAPRR
jgi:hypothetical protein